MAAYRSAAWRGVAWRFTKGTRVIRPYTALQIIVVCASDWQLHRKARSDATRVDGRSDAVQLQPCRQSRPWRSGVDCVICVRPSCKRYASWPACVRGMDVAQVEQSNLLSSARPLINSHRQDKMSVSLNKPKETRNKTTQDHRIHLPFTQSLPKIELHAHLNGSIRRSTLASLANAAGLDIRTSQIIHGDARTLPEMFSVFNVIHQCVRGPKILQRITREICQDAETDGIVYLELRTTPRIHKEHNMNEEGYLLAVLNGIKEYTSSGNSIIRLILSIDRKDQPAIALRTIDLAVKYQSQGVVGIDLSGDPSQGEFSSWLPALKRARNFGLKITLHAGEIDERHEEMSQMLAFKPVSGGAVRGRIRITQRFNGFNTPANLAHTGPPRTRLSHLTAKRYSP